MFSPAEVAALPQQAVRAELTRAGEEKRRLDAYIALLAGRVKELSAPELGYSGMAQAEGARTPEALVQQLTGLSKNESSALVRVGSKPEYLAPISASEVGVAKVDAVRGGLGVPNEVVTESDLYQAAVKVAEETKDLTVEQAAAHARAVRDELDAANVAERTAQQRDARYLSIRKRIDGMFTIHGLLDPESAAVIQTATDAIIAPRRGGPRFVDKEKAAEQKRLSESDSRTVPQMMVDALVDLVSVAVRVPEGEMLTGSKGRVVIHTTREALTTGTGMTYLQGNQDLISAATAAAYACDNPIGEVICDHDGCVIDVNPDARLFSRKQREALAAMWNGCAFTDCERPPSWTESHHINPYAKGGKTITADGIPLCTHHHMLLHNNGWSITRQGNRYYLHTPEGNVTELRPKSPIHRTSHPRAA